MDWTTFPLAKYDVPGLRMRVYLAGRISGSQHWRDVLVKWPAGTPWSKSIRHNEWEEDAVWSVGEKPADGYPKSWPIIPNGFLEVADYVGPFAIDNFGNCNHGSLRKTVALSDAADPEQWKDSGRYILDQCFSAIDSADVVVAVITGDSPGTLCEMGYARAKGRPIIAVVREGVAWDWFPRSMCREVLTVADHQWFAEQVGFDLVHMRNDKGEGGSLGVRYDGHPLYRILSRDPDMQSYYRSPWRKRRRAAVLDRGEYKCALCASTEKLEVHHNCYTNLYREPDCDLTVLCDTCHTKADVLRRAQEKTSANTDVPF